MELRLRGNTGLNIRAGLGHVLHAGSFGRQRMWHATRKGEAVLRRGVGRCSRDGIMILMDRSKLIWRDRHRGFESDHVGDGPRIKPVQAAKREQQQEQQDMELAATTEARCLPWLFAPQGERLAISGVRKVTRLHLVSAREPLSQRPTSGGALDAATRARIASRRRQRRNAFGLLSIPQAPSERRGK